MTDSSRAPNQTTVHGSDNPVALASCLVECEKALHALTAGQLDAVVDSDGRPYLLRPAQEHLRRKEKRLQATLDSIADAIVIVNQGGVVIFESRGVGRVLDRADLEGTNFFKTIHADDVLTVHSAFVSVIENLTVSATTTFRQRAHDGSYRRLEATLTRLRESAAASVVFSLRLAASPQLDCPASPFLEFQSEEASARTRFLAMLAHDLYAALVRGLQKRAAHFTATRSAHAAPALLPLTNTTHSPINL